LRVQAGGKAYSKAAVHDIAGHESSRSSSRRYAWYAILLLCAVNVFNYMDRMALSVLLPFIKADLQLSDSELGVLVGFAFSLFYAIFGIPIAIWADRGVRRNIIAAALATWSVLTALSGAAQSFWQLFAARVGVGVGEAGCLPPSQSLTCDYVPVEQRPGAFAINGFGGIAGMMFGMALAGWLGGVIGWRWAFVVLGVPGLLLAIVVRLTLREPVRGRYDSERVRHLSVTPLNGLRLLWRCRTYKMLILFNVTNGFVQFGLNQWWPSFYSRVFELDPGTIGISLGIAIGLGSGLGVLVGGILANRAMQINVRLPLFIAGTPALLALSTALGSLFAPSFLSSMVLVTLTGLLWAVPAGPVIAAIYSVTTPFMRATAGAIATFFTSIIGIGLGPVCVGLVSDALADSFGQQSLRYALLVPVALHPLLAIAAFTAAKTLPRDLEALGAHEPDAQARVGGERHDRDIASTSDTTARSVSNDAEIVGQG
jgi:predicted MFS family arabinose efflux permease